MVFFRNDNNQPTFVIEGVDNGSLAKKDPDKNHDKYDHFERMKPDEAYLQRLRSGPIENFQKTVEVTDRNHHGNKSKFADHDKENRRQINEVRRIIASHRIISALKKKSHPLDSRQGIRPKR